MSETQTNTFTQGPLGAIYIKTALPIIFVMTMSGLLAVVDAFFLGAYVGPAALAAVTLMFPMYMLVVALSTLVSSGMSSLLARRLGAGDVQGAHAVYAGAHGLSFLLSGILIILFVVLGAHVALLVAGGAQELAELGLIYLSITVFFSPIMFVLSVNSDALRNEGRVGFMAAMSLFASLANMAFNYVLIVIFEMGVAGSAYGTAAAHFVAYAIIMVFRAFGPTSLRPGVLLRTSWLSMWTRILALGAPQSLNFIGIALGSAATIAVLQWVGAPGYEDTITAYGIITRVLTFTFLPLLGMSFAMQTITGNNYGAKLWQRSDSSLRMAMLIGLIYCATVQIIYITLPAQIASIFVDAPAVISEVARILPVMTATLFMVGPLMMISTYFQAIGSATRAAILGLTKAFAFAIPLTFALPLFVGEIGIWMSGPIADVCMLVLTWIVLSHAAKHQGLKLGLFHPAHL